MAGQNVGVRGTGTTPGELHLGPGPTTGSNYVGFKGPSTNPAADVLWQLPAADGATGQFLTTNGSGVLSWQSPTSGTSWTTFNALSGSITTYESSGVASIVRESAGLYKITWATAFADKNYLVLGSCDALNYSGDSFTLEGSNGGDSSPNITTTSVEVGCRIPSTNAYQDSPYISVLAIPSTGIGSTTNGNSQWTTSGSNITYSIGSVGIDSTAPAAVLDVGGTTKLGTAGNAFTAMGTCTTASITIGTTPTNYTCTNIPASTSVALSCSGTAAFSVAATLYCRATGTANQMACTASSGNTTAMVYNCVWVQP